MLISKIILNLDACLCLMVALLHLEKGGARKMGKWENGKTFLVNR